LSNIRYTTIT